MDTRKSALEYAQAHFDEALDELKELVEIPSVSTDPNRKEDMLRTAEWLQKKLMAIGMQKVQILPTKGHPVVVAEYHRSNGLPTVLVYGHYDVQPTDPIELWSTEPFQPTMVDEKLYGRGASDMKGQVIASILAVEAIMKTGEMPVNVKFILEGEEEIGSPNLRSFLQEHKNILSSDVAINPDTGMIGKDYPTVVFGLRGLAYFELRLYGPDHDLHSGVYGGIVRNPANVLAEIIAGLHDQDGRITLPGFYDRVRPLLEEERNELSRLPLNDNFYKEQTGATALWGEAGYTAIERVGARPTLDINGLLSGFTGKGSKTIIPSWAMAKISTRLVPDQDPKEVEKQLRQYLQERVPEGIRWELEPISHGNPSLSDRHHPAAIALAKALETVWGTRPLYKREGGSVSVVGDMQEILGIDSALTGFGLPDDNIHAPNEKLDIPTWKKGTLALIHFFFNYGKV